MNVIAKYFGVGLAVVLLSANGFFTAFAPDLRHHNSVKKASMQMCSCYSGDEAMTCSCCCAKHRSHTAACTSCEFSSAPCANPIAAVSPNVLDPAVQTQSKEQDILLGTRSEKFPVLAILLLSRTQDPLFHPPQSFSHIFS
ncbi:MAG: hypothetical protein KGJ59_00570 [Bacteroidota bacterium]|nr:hypothetical protein [Bacteroidota bacterium]